MCLFESQILFFKRAEIIGVNAINALKWNLKWVWLVAIATILSKNLQIFFSGVQFHTIDLFSPYSTKVLVPFSLSGHFNWFYISEKY